MSRGRSTTAPLMFIRGMSAVTVILMLMSVVTHDFRWGLAGAIVLTVGLIQTMILLHKRRVLGLGLVIGYVSAILTMVSAAVSMLTKNQLFYIMGWVFIGCACIGVVVESFLRPRRRRRFGKTPRKEESWLNRA